jgi:hypothetical protein
LLTSNFKASSLFVPVLVIILFLDDTGDTLTAPTTFFASTVWYTELPTGLKQAFRVLKLSLCD